MIRQHSSIYSAPANSGDLPSSMLCSRAPGGLAQAFIIGAEFVRGHPSCLILGDNILYGHGLPDALHRADSRTEGASIFSYWVENPQRYGVVEFDENDEVLSIEEKPQVPKSNWAAIGLYFYDEEVVDLVRHLKPSERGELEITDLNLLYLHRRRLTVERLGRGFAWFDAGTHNSLLEVRGICASVATQTRATRMRAGRNRFPQRLDQR